MHELSIASALAEKVLAFAEGNPAVRILRVKLAVGELTCIQTEQLDFCYRAITQETSLAESSLEVEAVATVVNCPACGYTGKPKYWDDAQWRTSVPTLVCPDCGAAAEALQGNECAIRTITYAR